MADYEIGASREETVEVVSEYSTTFLGPEGPRVLSTPRMIALMEGACRNLVLRMLERGHDTVGTHVNVYHRKAAPMGSSVTVRAELTGVNERRIAFAVSVKMGDAVIGEGTHERAVIEVRAFRQRVEGT
jgi:fluoroacetyl-CoA thioesterase